MKLSTKKCANFWDTLYVSM